MSKNVWLERADKKKTVREKAAAASVKFKGKFQEANKINKQGRIYTSEALEKSIRDIAAEGKAQTKAEQTKAAVEAIKEAVPDATVIVNCCTRTMIEASDVAERWKAPSDDECGWVPIRPTAEAIKINQDSVKEVSDEARNYIKFKECDFIDLSTVTQHNSRYKEYDRLRQQTELMKDAMTVYRVGRGEPKEYQLMDISIVSSGGEPIGSIGPIGPQGSPGPQGMACEQGMMSDEDYFRNKLFKALVMPSKISSRDIAACRKMERESGESPVEWREMARIADQQDAKMKKIEEIKLQVMAQNPMIMGVPAPAGMSFSDVAQSFSSYVPGNYQITGGCGLYPPQNVSGACFSGSVQIGTPIRFAPEQISHHVIGGERRVFSVDVKPEKAEKFMAKLKESFKKKRTKKDEEAAELKAEFTKRAMEKMEALAAESETWFAPNGPNRGHIPSIVEVFANVAVDVYQTLTAKIDHMCNEVFLDSTVTITGGVDPKMAESVMSMDKLPACETFTVTSSEGWNQPGVGKWNHDGYDVRLGGC